MVGAICISGKCSWSSSKTPIKTSSRPPKIDRRSRGSLAIGLGGSGSGGSSDIGAADVAIGRGHRAKNFYRANHDQDDRGEPDEGEVIVAKLLNEEEHADGDQHHRTHDPAQAAARAGAANTSRLFHQVEPSLRRALRPPK